MSHFKYKLLSILLVQLLEKLGYFFLTSGPTELNQPDMLEGLFSAGDCLPGFDASCRNLRRQMRGVRSLRQVG